MSTIAVVWCAVPTVTSGARPDGPRTPSSPVQTAPIVDVWGNGMMDDGAALGAPEYLELQLTTACQYSCSYCGSPDGVAAGRAQYHPLCDLIREVRPRRVSFTGGEPTLAWSLLMDLLRCSSSVGSRSQLNTNCRALTRERIRELEDNGLDVLHASLSTLDPGKFERVRRTHDPEGLEHILRMVAYASAHSHMRVIVEAMLMSDLLDGLQDVYEFALDSGAGEFELQAVIPTDSEMWRIVPEDADVVDAIDVLVALRSMELPITLCCLHLPDCLGYDRWSRAEGVTRYTCGCGRDTLYVAVDGSIMPCSFFHEKPGHIRDGVIQVWRGAPLLRRMRRERPATCRTCGAWDSCRNTCPALVYQATGGFDELAHDSHHALRSRMV